VASNLVAFGDDGAQLQALDALNRALSMGSHLDLRVSLYLPGLVRVVSEGRNSEIVLLAIRAINQIIDIEPRAGAFSLLLLVLVFACHAVVQCSSCNGGGGGGPRRGLEMIMKL